jgi:phospholipid/cholesterol/gamma-HCH transport system substrate-binding protein
VPLDEDGIPTLTADLSEIESIRDSLHNVDRFLVSNQATLKDTLGHFETETASLASKSEAIDSVIRKADSAFDSFDSAVSRINHAVPGMADGSADELFQKLRSIHEWADSFNRHSGALMEEGRRSLQDISESAVNVTRKFDPQAAIGGNPAPPRKPGVKRP